MRARRRTRACRSRSIRRRLRRRRSRRPTRRTRRCSAGCRCRSTTSRPTTRAHRRQPDSRRRQRLADLQARARDRRAVVRRRLGVPAGVDRPQQHVRRLRDLRAAESREGPRRNGARKSRAPATAGSPRQEVDGGEEGRCWKSAALRARRTTRWRARSCRRHSSAGRGPTRRKSMRAIAAVSVDSRTRRCASMSTRRASRMAYAGDFAKAK